MSFLSSNFSDESVSTIKDFVFDQFFDLALGNSPGFIGTTLANFATTKAFEFFDETKKKTEDSFLKIQARDLLHCTGQNLYFTLGSSLAHKALKRFSPLVQKIAILSLPPLLQMGWKVLNGEPITSPTLKDCALATVVGVGNLRMGIIDQRRKAQTPRTASEHLLDHPLVHENLQGYKTAKTLPDFIKILTRADLERAKRQGTPNDKINLRIFSKGYDKGAYVSITPDPDDIKDLVEYAHITIDLNKTSFGISGIQARSQIVRDRIVGEAYLNTDIPISQAYVPTAFAGFGNDYLASSKKAVPASELADHIRKKEFFMKLEEVASTRPLNDAPDLPPQQFVIHTTLNHKTRGAQKVTASFEIYEPIAFGEVKDRNMAITLEISPEGRIVVKEIQRAHLLSDHALILDGLGISREDQLRLTTGLIRKERVPKSPVTPFETLEAPEPKSPELEEIVTSASSLVLTHRPSIQFEELHTRWVVSSQLDDQTRRAIELELESAEVMLTKLENRYPTFYKAHNDKIERWYRIHSSGRTTGQQMLNTIRQRRTEIENEMALHFKAYRVAS